MKADCEVAISYTISRGAAGVGDRTGRLPPRLRRPSHPLRRDPGPPSLDKTRTRWLNNHQLQTLSIPVVTGQPAYGVMLAAARRGQLGLPETCELKGTMVTSVHRRRQWQLAVLGLLALLGSVLVAAATRGCLPTIPRRSSRRSWTTCSSPGTARTSQRRHQPAMATALIMLPGESAGLRPGRDC
jgi:hypothetical protein